MHLQESAESKRSTHGCPKKIISSSSLVYLHLPQEQSHYRMWWLSIQYRTNLFILPQFWRCLFLCLEYKVIILLLIYCYFQLSDNSWKECFLSWIIKENFIEKKITNYFILYLHNLHSDYCPHIFYCYHVSAVVSSCLHQMLFSMGILNRTIYLIYEGTLSSFRSLCVRISHFVLI